MIPILSTEAAIDRSHNEMYGDIQIIFFNDDAISHFRAIILVFKMNLWRNN